MRSRADAIFRCGGTDVLSLPYLDFVGLWLNLERQDWREAMAVKRGIEMALGKGDLPMEVFDATVLIDSVKAKELAEWNENAARWKAHNYEGRRS